MESVNEKSTCFITVSFFDEDGGAVTPDHAWYKLDCIASGTVLQVETAMTGLSTSKEIVVTADQNRILRDVNVEEEKVMTVRFTYSNWTKQGTAEYRYKVLNLAKLS